MTKQKTARALTGATVGVDAMLVKVEVDLSQQLPAMSTVGLAATEVRESKDRVRSAIRNSGFDFPKGRVTVNLAPADVPKSGTAFDLPIATALLAAEGKEIAAGALDGWMFLGELSLDGDLRPVNGVLPVAIAARDAGCCLVVPQENGPEAACVRGLEVRTARTLKEVAHHFGGDVELPEARPGRREREMDHPADLAQVRGHPGARRALEVAAAGGHNLLMVGPPGVGKTLLARCLGTILPPMTEEEQLEVTSIHSIAGTLTSRGLMVERPFRAPHPSVRPEAIIGGGRPIRPGEATLSHRGVLFLDEFPELDRDVLEALRGPLEDREIQLARAGRWMRFPASFTLVAAMNPCPCGYFNSTRCSCGIAVKERYQKRISGPLLDRIELQADLHPLSGWEFEGPPPENSETVRARVVEARERAWRRFAAAGLPKIVASNAEVPRNALEATSRLTELARLRLNEQVDNGMSGRSRERTIRVARTLADLDGEDVVTDEHVNGAVGMRRKEGEHAQ